MQDNQRHGAGEPGAAASLGDGAPAAGLDAADFPLVRTRAPRRTLSEAEAAAFLADLAALLDRDRRYAVIALGGAPDVPPALRGDFARWFKRERERLGRLCAGMAAVIEDADARATLAAQISAASAQGAYPYPVVVVASEAAAVAWAEARLRVSPERPDAAVRQQFPRHP